ncbi:hypothetical protein PanWU01x14_356590 [Parasponia andersonii]|uniref:Uncharacterized protein n=1 Tax=Parasponia andersonii TaxID=3476 RepID=A0A2P5A8X3_PARAD|nr:hypothetical protein PanWU01x14_356590 [Parasponia andersonii]
MGSDRIHGFGRKMLMDSFLQNQPISSKLMQEPHPSQFSVLKTILQWQVLSNVVPIQTRLAALFTISTVGVDSVSAFLYASITMDHIWKTRNEVVQWKIYSKCGVPVTISWQPPLEGWVKINFDVAMGSQKMCLAIIGRDHGGSIHFAVTQ